jgi:hypothetical protein
MPWNRPELEGWDVIGLNHYTLAGERRLFVGMVRGTRWIRAEGPDENAVFADLAAQAALITQ